MYQIRWTFPNQNRSGDHVFQDKSSGPKQRGLHYKTSPVLHMHPCAEFIWHGTFLFCLYVAGRKKKTSDMLLFSVKLKGALHASSEFQCVGLILSFSVHRLLHAPPDVAGTQGCPHSAHYSS